MENSNPTDAIHAELLEHYKPKPQTHVVVRRIMNESNQPGWVVQDTDFSFSILPVSLDLINEFPLQWVAMCPELIKYVKNPSEEVKASANKN
jgi:hypothetical protein